MGPVEVWAGERRLVLGGPRQLALQAFLLLHANRAVSTDALIEALWGPQPDGAMKRLQVAIARLRKALEPLNGDAEPALRTVAGGYLLALAPDQLDAEVFRARVRVGRDALRQGEPVRAVLLLEHALELWRGPPLAEVAFEDFVQAELRGLQELRLVALEARIDAQLQLGRHVELLGELDALLAEQPTRESLAGLLMLALYRAGRQADALEVYQRIRAHLASELGLEPGPALKALQVEILEQAPSLAATGDSLRLGIPAVEADAAVQLGVAQRAQRVSAPLPPRVRPYGPRQFVNREDEYDALMRALANPGSSGGRAAFLTGEAGIGKTRLVSQVAQAVHAAGTVVLAGRCDEELSLPYQPFAEALEQLVEHAPQALLEAHVAEYGDSVARLVPALTARLSAAAASGRVASDSERYVLYRAIEGLLSAAGGGGAVLVVLEDLHWADLPTLRLLRRLLTSPKESPVMLLCTCRVAELPDCHSLRELLADLHREPGVLRIDLRGLDSRDIGMFIGGIVDGSDVAADGRLADALQASTSGNPFFVSELVRSLAETQTIVKQGDRWQLAAGADLDQQMPPSISETLARRLRRLGEEARNCVHVAAVIGNEFDVDLVTAVAEDPSAATALDRARAGGIVTEVTGTRGRLRFAHALMHRFAYHELGPARRRELHRRVALALEGHGEAGSRVAEVARHWVAAPEADVGKALSYVIRAGDEAFRQLAPDEARRWYEVALELLDRAAGGAGPKRCELLVKLGDAQRQLGDRSFRETLLEAAAIAEEIGAGPYLVQAALANTRGMQSETGVVDEARIATLKSALRLVGEGYSPERARLLAQHAAELSYSQQWQQRVGLSDDALAIARRIDDPGALSAVLNMRFVTLLAPETLTERADNAAEAVAVADRLTDPLALFYAYHWRYYVCVEQGDTAAARSWAAREREIAERFRQPTTLWLACADEANLAIVAGDFDAATQLSAAALEMGAKSEPDAFACYAAHQASIAFETGSMSELIPMMEQVVEANPGVPGFRATLALALSETSRAERARTLLSEAVASTLSALPYDVTWLTVACIYAHVAFRLQDAPAAAALCPILEPWRDQIAFPAFGVWGPVSLYLGSLALTLGNDHDAERDLADAIGAARRAAAPAWEARARRLLASLPEVAI